MAVRGTQVERLHPFKTGKERIFTNLGEYMEMSLKNCDPDFY